MKSKKNHYKVTYAKAVYGAKEISAVIKVLKSQNTSMGQNVKSFEECVAKLFDKKFGIMVNSGSSANMIAARILALPKGSEIITPILTFSTTIAPFLQNGVVPAFVDVKNDTYQIDVDQIEQMITKKTKALVIPSLIGNLPDLPRLRAIAKKHNLLFLEDSCDTLGSKFNGKPTGSFSDISTTSFYGSHIITAAGNGGMVCVNRDEWNQKAIILRGWGRSSSVISSENVKDRFKTNIEGKPYDAKFLFTDIGYNFIPNELEAAFGLTQLDKLSLFRKIRQKNFKTLKTFFKKYEDVLILPSELPGADTVWLAFPLTIRDGAPFSRYEIVEYLEKNGIQTRPVFAGNILRQPGFSKIEAKRNKNGYPVADKIMKDSFLIGCHHGMSEEQLNFLKNTFHKFFNKF
jgi:CDP-6-deoxy-D-xylo-4-hexulose-3-dehydrase